MPIKRSRYPGDPRGGPPKPVPPRKPNKIDVYSVFWKDPEDRKRGTVWLYHSRELKEAAGIRQDKEIPWRQTGHQPSLTKARGKKWYAIYSDDEEYMYLASPMATKRIMAHIASRWATPPMRLRQEGSPAFTLHDLQDETHSHVYLVQLLTFDKTVAGQHYYKIGKAKSIPKRIKQFGPCQLIKSIKLGTEQDSLRVEAELHSKFSCFRKPSTEIFCMNEAELNSVLAECMLYETLEQS
jgi:hypothetical protein